MAIKPVSNETFYREVDEELRRDQMAGFWKRYGRWMVAGVVLLLAAIAGFLYWQQHKQEKAAGQGETLIAAFEEAQARKTREATAKLDTLASEGTPGYRAAALVTKADMAIEAGNDAAAAQVFGQIAGDEALPEPYRNLALIRQTTIEYDRLPPATVVQRLGGLAKPGNPWFGSAGELVAIAHLRQNKPALAAPIFAALAKDQKVPRSIRSRALQMAGSLGVDATEATPEKEVTQ